MAYARVRSNRCAPGGKSHLAPLRTWACPTEQRTNRRVEDSSAMHLESPIPPAQAVALLARWREIEGQHHEGWDFSHLARGLTEDDPPWDFDEECRVWLARSRHVLDMGTGGGERLSGLRGVLPKDTVASEGWAPNLPVARARLAELSIPVVAYDPDAEPPTEMPFRDGRFDLVMNRHESFDPHQLIRVLEPGGVFVTQQVAADDCRESEEIFGSAPRYPDVTLEVVAGQLTGAGFRIEASMAWRGTYRFHDVGTLVGYFNLVPWQVPVDFCVNQYAGTLLRLHAEGPAVDHPVRFTKSRFWLRASKPT
jgi:SAM-dependent methyltransferase